MKNETLGAAGRVASGKDTETRILESAAEMFASRGFRASTMRDIAFAARINEVTIYRYFPAKQNLCWRAVDWKLRNASVSEALIHPLTKAGELKSQLELFLVTALQLLEREPKLARLLYFASLELDPYESRAIYDNHIRPVVGALLLRLRAWMQSGDIRQVNPETAALGILGTLLLQLQFQLIDTSLGEKHTFEHRSAECVDFCLRGLQTSSPNNTSL